MSKAEQIESIIAQRHPLARKIEDIESHLRELNTSIQNLEENRNQQLQYWSEDSETQSKLSRINLTTFRQRASEELEVLHRLQARFSRNTLNIGVIGRMGQGKSTLLQSLSGLDDEVIPAHPGKACTAARSTIYHREGDSTTAEIQFHSEDSFLKEVILPYYEKLNLTPKPISVEEFANTPLPELPDRSNQTNINIYNRLKYDYHANANHYKELLNRANLNVQDRSKIANYVAQKYDAEDRLINYECLAVKHVKIFCSFPSHKIGSISLVDVPGLGDFKLGDESLIIEALAQEVDFILLIRKPSKDRANFEQSDTQLYDLADKALNDLKDRSLIVLNADRNGENHQSCKSLQRDIEMGNVKMPVLGCIIADCSSPEESDSKVLQAVLSNLRSNVTELDKRYAETQITSLEEAIQQLKQQIELCQDALPDVDSHQKEEEYDDLFDDFWNRITNSFEELRKRLIENRDEPDRNLKQAIDDVFEKCNNEFDTLDVKEIESLRNREEGSYSTAYDICLNDIRTNLSRQFLDIDRALKASIDRTKSSVADVLIEEGQLERLAEGRGADFLKEVADKIPQDYTELKKGFEIISEFNLSYRGLIQHRIREKLDPLTPDKTSKLKKNSDAQDVREQLIEEYEHTFYNCKGALEDFLSEPSQASFAIVEEFIDRTIRAKSVKTIKGVRREWKKFLRRERNKIWSAQFDRLQERIDLKDRWLHFTRGADEKLGKLEDLLHEL
jgi:energy-coupling factor transporter ATP-binding protein EcfA2